MIELSIIGILNFIALCVIVSRLSDGNKIAREQLDELRKSQSNDLKSVPPPLPRIEPRREAIRR